MKKEEKKIEEKKIEGSSVARIGSVCNLSKSNISLWYGSTKSKKTFVLSMLAAAVSGGVDFTKKINPVCAGKVLFFNTGDDIRRMSSCDYGDLNVYSLQSFSAVKRMEMIENIISIEKDVVLVIIDNVFDLVINVDLGVEATIVVAKLMKMAMDYDFHLACVINSNKSDTHARGHLGTELNNKSEAVFRIVADEMNNEISYIENVCSRGDEFDMIEICTKCGVKK